MKWLSLVTSLLLFISLTVDAYSTTIQTQSQFEAAVAMINNGEEMRIILLRGKYVLKTPIRAKAPLSIKGKGATITSVGESYNPSRATRETQTHYVYKLNSELSLFPLFYGKDGSLLAVSESVIDSIKVNYVRGDIVSSDGFKKGLAIKIPIAENLNHLKNKDFASAYGYLDCGWETVNFKLERSDDTYFYCKTLNNCATKDFQYDRSTYKKPIRYVIYNAEKKVDAIHFDREWLYVPKKMGEVYAVNLSDETHMIHGIATYSDVIIDGVSFCGGTKVSIHAGKDERCEIKNCSFRNTLGYALNIVKTNGKGAQVVVVEDCTFQSCSVYSGSVVLLTSNKNNGEICIEMRGCTVSRYPSDCIIYKNSKGAIWADGDILLKENVVYNTCRNHLHLCKGRIVANGNFLYNTDVFDAQADRNLSSDWGLIYCDHKNKDIQEALDNKSNRITIEANLLYGAYAYGGDARGVFVDHGRGDVTCNENVILNTQRYSMDSRNVKKNEVSSVRNRYEGNIMTSNYRLMAGEGIEGQNVPITCGNNLLTASPSKVLNTYAEQKDKLVMIDASCTCKGGQIVVSKALYKLIKGSRAWKYNGMHVRPRR